MRLEIHTFDPELLAALMGLDLVSEGSELSLPDGTKLRYERTFTRRVKHFPLILHFSIDITSGAGPGATADWLFGRAGRRNMEKIVVEDEDARLDPEQLKCLLGRRI